MSPSAPLGLLPSDPFFYGILAAILGFFFVVYMMLRRTLLGFREGVDRGRR